MGLIFEKEIEIKVDVYEALEEVVDFINELKEITEITEILYQKHYKLWNKLNYLCTYEIKE